MTLTIPELSLVVLMGASGSGKSSFAARHFLPTEVLSSDVCRGLVCDDENSQSVSAEAFEVLRFVAAKRLALGRLTVVDATNVRPEDRRWFVELARAQHVLAVAIVFDLDPRLCAERNALRPDRNFGAHVVRGHSRCLRHSLRGLQREGFHQVKVLSSPEEVDEVTIARTPLWCDKRGETGPFDIIGDVHGCLDELRELLTALGYAFDNGGAEHPEGRRAVFLGDLADRGPDSPGVLRLVMAMTAQGSALCVPGNHDVKLERALRGRDVRQTHGLAETMVQLATEPPEFRAQVADFIASLVSHYVLDSGALVVAHAGLRAELQGRASGQVRAFALYGETTGETDEYGLPVRYFWAGDYRGAATVVYGHTPVPEATWTNRTLCIDTGCVFGGQLTALRYPERELVQVPARRTYYEPVRPLQPPPDAARPAGDLLDIEDVLGKRIIATRTLGLVTIREENALAALEVLGRFAADPRWLVYLPPTMAPADTCREGNYLEHPREAFDYFRDEGVARVVCQEKHMGSRAVVVLCRDEATARRRFSVSGGERGMVLTRTGRPFFAQAARAAEVIDRLCGAVERAGLWSTLDTDWLCLDTELMPWSAKAQELLRTQYAPTGAAARAAFADAIGALEQAQARGGEAGSAELLARLAERQACTAPYVDAWRRYCWRVDSVDDLKIAPFHLLAGEGHVYTDRDHLWHMATLADLCAADPALLRATPCLTVDPADPDSEAAGIAWWEQLTERGGEGMVVKPLDWLTKGPHGLVQPAVKCRGREYLRIIYGPEYTRPDQMDRLRRRSLGTKRAMALREYALGLEALHRFVEGEPLYRVHECVLGVLAMESHPVDPRL